MKHKITSRRIAMRSFWIILLMIFLVETLIMGAFHLLFLTDNVWLEVFTDATLLALLLFPSLYYLMLRPMELEIEARQQSENALLEANDQAEIRIKQRTAELEIEISERQQTEVALQKINEKLKSSVTELERRNEEATILTEMNDLFQACTSTEEAYRMIRHIGPRLFPSSSGKLFMYSPSHDDLESALTWGSLPQEQTARKFEPGTCWALRRGRAHGIENLCEGLACHTSVPERSGLCVPMIAQGESLGVLFLQENESGNSTHPINEQLAVTASEQIAMAIANLRLRETLRSQSILDPLTGIYNRRFMEETLAREIRRAERNQRELSLLMFDLDHFKQFNDTFGHEAGDVLLRELGQLLKSSIRGGDIACRFGGEEFVLILPELTTNEAKQRAEEIRQKTRKLTVMHRGQALGIVTVSLGVATYPNHSLTAEELLHMADMALYQAKASGRDRVITAEE